MDKQVILADKNIEISELADRTKEVVKSGETVVRCQKSSVADWLSKHSDWLAQRERAREEEYQRTKKAIKDISIGGPLDKTK
ncbi:MAG: hypothetical protein IJM97_00070 [Clostridia bacterium]|nr:hypothetical protein [Clostridia bacterium]